MKLTWFEIEELVIKRYFPPGKSYEVKYIADNEGVDFQIKEVKK